VLLPLKIHAQSGHYAFAAELLPVDHQHPQRTKLINPPFAQLLQGPARGFLQFPAYRALADAAAFGEVVDRLLVFPVLSPFASFL